MARDSVGCDADFELWLCGAVFSRASTAGSESSPRRTRVSAYSATHRGPFAVRDSWQKTSAKTSATTPLSRSFSFLNFSNEQCIPEAQLETYVDQQRLKRASQTQAFRFARRGFGEGSERNAGLCADLENSLEEHVSVPKGRFTQGSPRSLLCRGRLQRRRRTSDAFGFPFLSGLAASLLLLREALREVLRGVRPKSPRRRSEPRLAKGVADNAPPRRRGTSPRDPGTCRERSTRGNSIQLRKSRGALREA